MSVTESLRVAMCQAGIDYDGPIHPDGKRYRFKAKGDKARNSWYILYPDSPCAGAFGCWKRNISEKWSDRSQQFSTEQWTEARRRWQESERQQAKEQRQRKEKAAKLARWICRRIEPAQASHPYLAKKSIEPCSGLLQWRQVLILPLSDADGQIQSLQLIFHDGTKLFLRNGHIEGCSFALPDDAGGPLVICEGLSTGISIHRATGHAVVCAMNCGNLLSVATSLRARHANREIIMAADNDQWTTRPPNPGLNKATEAAKAIGARLAVPQFADTTTKPTDFNDLHTMEGITAVRQQFETAAEVVKPYEDQCDELARLSPAEYDRCRKDKAGALNVRLSTLDAEVQSRRTVKARVAPALKAEEPEDAPPIATDPTEPGKTCVILPSGSVTITEAATKIYELIAPTHRIFIRGKTVVYLLRNMRGQIVLEPVRASAARSLFEQFASFVVWRAGRNDKKVLQPTVLPEEMARAILDCNAGLEALPRINGLVSCPVLVETENGLRLCKKGYSPETGLLVLDGANPATVPLDEATKALRSLLEDFHFQTPSDHARALAAFITPALKMGNLIRDYVPIDVAEANDSQSGKGYRQKMIAAIYGEKLAIVPLKNEGVGGIDESLYEKLVNGRPFIQFDNYRGMLNSCVLESFLTADGSFPCRIPHCREIEVDPSRFFILLTSNGVETTRDLANRSSIVRIFKRVGVQWPDPPALDMITRRQSYYLGCVFAIAQEWHRLGKPKTAETRHDFREWCQSLDWIVQNIFGAAPLMDGHLDAQERVSNPTLTFLRTMALAVEKANMLGEPMIASQLAEMAEDGDIPIPGLHKGARQGEDAAKKSIGAKLGVIFKDKSSLELDGFIITRTEEDRARPDGNGSRSVKSYTFIRPHLPLNPHKGIRATENCTNFLEGIRLEGTEGEVGKNGAESDHQEVTV